VSVPMLVGLVSANRHPQVFAELPVQGIVSASYDEVKSVVVMERAVSVAMIAVSVSWAVANRNDIEPVVAACWVIFVAITILDITVLLVRISQLRSGRGIPSRPGLRRRVLGLGPLAAATLGMQSGVLLTSSVRQSNAFCRGAVMVLGLHEAKHSLVESWLSFMVLLRLWKFVLQIQSSWGLGRQVLAIVQSFVDFWQSGLLLLLIFSGIALSFLAIEGVAGGAAASLLPLYRAIFFADGDGLDQMVGKDDAGNYEQGAPAQVLTVIVTVVFTFLLVNINIGVVSNSYDYARERWWLSLYRERARVAAAVLLGVPKTSASYKAVAVVARVVVAVLGKCFGCFEDRVLEVVDRGASVLARATRLLSAKALDPVCFIGFSLLAAQLHIRDDHPSAAVSLALALITLQSLLVRSPDGGVRRYLWICSQADFHRNNYLPEDMQESDAVDVRGQVDMLQQDIGALLSAVQSMSDRQTALEQVVQKLAEKA